MMFDLIVIGSGPAGLAVAVEAKRNRLDCLVIDKGTIVNSIVDFPTDMTFFSTSELLEIGGIPFTSAESRSTRREAVQYYQKVADYFKLNLKSFEQVTAMEKVNSNFILYTKKLKTSKAQNYEYSAKNIVLATGFYDKPKMLNVDGEYLPHVSHYYKDSFSYFNRNVLIVGGGNSAVEASLDIFRHGGKVSVMHRGSEVKKSIKYWIMPDFENRVKEDSIKLIANAEVHKIQSDGVQYKTNGKKEWHACDDVLLLTGYEPDEQIFNMCNIEYNTETLEPVFEKKSFQSSIKNLYLAGSLIAGKFSNRIFIENSRDHAKPIIDDILVKLNKTRK